MPVCQVRVQIDCRPHLQTPKGRPQAPTLINQMMARQILTQVVLIVLFSSLIS